MRLAEQRLDSRRPLAAGEVQRARRYDAARAALPAGIDEGLFLNERGEVCEGTITNVFVDSAKGC